MRTALFKVTKVTLEWSGLKAGRFGREIAARKKAVFGVQRPEFKSCLSPTICDPWKNPFSFFNFLIYKMKEAPQITLSPIGPYEGYDYM